MKIIDKYRLEKDNVFKEWIVFERIGKSAWQQVFKSKNKKNAKEWIKTKNKEEIK